jgi:hypothetical protein
MWLNSTFQSCYTFRHTAHLLSCVLKKNDYIYTYMRVCGDRTTMLDRRVKSVGKILQALK